MALLEDQRERRGLQVQVPQVRDMLRKPSRPLPVPSPNDQQAVHVCMLPHSSGQDPFEETNMHL